MKNLSIEMLLEMFVNAAIHNDAITGVAIELELLVRGLALMKGGNC